MKGNVSSEMKFTFIMACILMGVGIYEADRVVMAASSIILVILSVTIEILQAINSQNKE